MAEKSMFSQFREIEKEVKSIVNDIARETSKEVVKDLKKVHKEIMDDFYGSYTPKGKRKYVRTNNLRNNSIIEQNPIGSWDIYDSGVVVSSFGMHPNYNISPDNVFDLMWNKGVRGLPKIGTRQLDNGERWQNPFWQSKYGERGNVFRTSVTLGGYTSKSGTPAQVMAEITNHWKEAGGEETCDRIKEKVIKKY